MSTDLSFALFAFSATILVVDPFAALPIFLALTAGDSEESRRSQAARAAITTFVVLTLFALTGGFIFRLFGVTLGAFKVAGGIVLFLMAADMIRATPSRTRTTAAEQAEGAAQEDVAIVPIAVPIMAGPGAIATVMVLMSRAAWRPLPTAAVFAAITLTSAASWLLLRAAASGRQLLPTTTLKILERLMGLLLAAVAVEFVAEGLRDLVPMILPR